MATYNQLLASSFADFVRRRFGEEVMLDTIAPELIPVIALQLDRPDWAFLWNDILLGNSDSQAANAGSNSALQLRNPAGSDVIATVQEVEVAPGTATEVELGVLANQPNLGTLSNSNVSRDGRGLGLGVGACVMSRQNGSAGANQIRRVSLLANTPWSWKVPIVLSPNTTVRVTTVNINIILDASFTWVERRARPEELK